MQQRSTEPNVKEFFSSLTTGFKIPYWNQHLRNDHLSSFGSASKKTIHNCLKRQLEYSSLFQLHITQTL